ncbi:EcsC family protein [Streptomyces sp. Ag109_O5-1]|uniref:EcsC family protein n=1 Tax=Streptomyces sp. Ag109_O5-1 TaxID=1938851 RepID=UPI000F91D4D3|nr:EcsC family protein [Streptomyces sp. Ag109_O5-1]RPE44409.1 EcsC family protein [Streptomyces sp. Ag109_O5-1]
MSTDADRLPGAIPAMSEYDKQVWAKLNDHWQRRNNRRGLPNWASTALTRTGEAAGKATRRVADAVPDAVSEPMRRAGDAVADKALRPALAGAAALLDLVNESARELNDPKNVEKIARKQGLDLESFTELRKQELKFCDRLLTRNTLKWRTAGALEGGAMGVLALVPVAGIPAAMTADILVVQVLSTSIASRIAYSYGYDAKDPEEQVFIQRLVRRSFMAQAAKAEPLRDTARAAHALKGRVNWSQKLRQDHRLVAALEKLMQQLGPAGSRVPVQNVAKVVPFVGILVGAGMNAAVLGRVAADAQRYCQTRFLCEKYGLPLPAALATDDEYEDPQPDVT